MGGLPDVKVEMEQETSQHLLQRNHDFQRRQRSNNSKCLVDSLNPKPFFKAPLSGADWLVGQFGRIPDGPAARREKVRESMETFAFLSISAH